VVQAKQAYPSVPVIAIINPNSGPGASQDPNYVQGIQNLQAAGVIVYGYVDTAYAGDSISSVEANVNLYVSWYHVDGILFDDMNNQVGYESYYSTLGSYVSSLGLKSMGNPGTSVPTSFIGTLDALCIYESGGLPALSFITYPGYGPSNFAVVALGVPLDTTFLAAASSLVGWVYLTDASGSNPYDVLPSYFASEVAAISSIDGGSSASSTSTSTFTPTSTTTSNGGAASLTVASVDLSGNPLSGLWTTWSQGSAALAAGYTPATFSGTDGQTYTLYVADYNNYVFCSWQDGGINSTREVTLAGNEALTAVYSTTGACPAATTYPVFVQSAYYNGT
ncbi:MAG TPA: spherulation-specific family 4 protein, partial [Nitrososphaerales archaeon]|nr:spherulation-specific family 4 protein [Nitrososphaerales archaeon]